MDGSWCDFLCSLNQQTRGLRFQSANSRILKDWSIILVFSFDQWGGAACSEEEHGDFSTESWPDELCHWEIKSPGSNWTLFIYCQIGLCKGTNTHPHTHTFNICQGWDLDFTYEWFPLILILSLFVLAQVRIYPTRTKMMFFIIMFFIDISGRSQRSVKSRVRRGPRVPKL